MISRFAEKAVVDALSDTPVVLIHGPRQAGKSTLSNSFKDRTYVTLDDPIPRGLAQTDPAGFLKTYGDPLTIDEIQRAPELFLALKSTVDKDRRPGRFLLTGSANVLSLPKIADSLAGRMEVVDLLPFSQAEKEGARHNLIDTLFKSDMPQTGDQGDLAGRIVSGGFPEPSMRTSAARRDAWFEGYVRTLLERDIRDLSNIEALSQMPRVLKLVAARSGETLNVVSLSRDTGIPNTTLHRYLDLLRALFLLQDVMAWSIDAGARLTKTPKVFMVDQGLACYLTNTSADDLRSDQDKMRQALSGFVAMELRKLAKFSGLRPDLYHLRTVRQLEVDFVLEARGGKVFGIELKPAHTLVPSDADGLRFLKELAGPKFVGGAVLYLGDEILPLDQLMTGLPISCLWS